MKVAREYKGYLIYKTGTKEYPYNIYKGSEHVGYERTLKDCKYIIDFWETQS